MRVFGGVVVDITVVAFRAIDSNADPIPKQTFPNISIRNHAF